MKHRADVIVFTALPVETRAVREHLREPFSERVVSGGVFKLGTFAGRHARWTVAVHETGPGAEGAAALVGVAVAAFTPRYVFFTGIAGGLKDVAHGDVVAARHVYDYQSGRDERDGMRPRMTTFPSAHDLTQRAQVVAGEDEWQHRITAPPPDGMPRAYVKPLAAGSKLVADPESATARSLRDFAGDALAVEMEGYGFMRGAHTLEGVGALVVRGISDLLSDKDGDNDRNRQPAAARHAAAFTFELLHQLHTPRARRRGLGEEALNTRRAQPTASSSTIGFGPDETVVAIDGDGAIERWELGTGRILPGVPGGAGLRTGHQALPSTVRHTVAVSRPNGLELVHFDASGEGHRRVDIRLDRDEFLVTSGGEVLATHDRRRLAVRSFDDGRVIHEVACPANLAASAISSAGTTVALATTNRVFIHRPEGGPVEKKFRNRLEIMKPGCALAVSPSGSHVACASLREMLVWRTEDESVVLHRAFDGKEAFDGLGAAGMRLTCTDNGLVIWLRRGKLSQVTDDPEIRQLEQAGRYDDISLHPSGHLLAAAGDKGLIRAWEWHG